jgi:hypothetical protein
MVAKIVIGKKLRGALNYNENKVAQGHAELILASGFAGDIEQLNFNQKLQRFQNLLMLKPSVKTNTLHISLNFDAGEKLTIEKLQQIAVSYMDKIGFGDQPFLTYRHHDAAHDHIHLVTTNIQADATAIDLHNIGRIKSEQARKSIEEEFNLVKAEGKKFKPEPSIKAIDLQVAQYGRIPTKRAISNTVNAVINDYKFTSVPELNAVLKQFNLTAWRCDEESAMFEKKGLVYSLIDEYGNRQGIPIKASAFYLKPTLSFLEQEFEKHRISRANDKPELRKRIDKVMRTAPENPEQLIKTLKAQGIALVFRESKDRQVYGVTFVDHIQKTVFNGSDLGKAYTAKTLMDQIDRYRQSNNMLTEGQNQPALGKDKSMPASSPADHHLTPNSQESLSPLLEALLKEESHSDPNHQHQKKKKRKQHLKI